MRISSIKAALSAVALVFALLQPAVAAEKQKFFFMYFSSPLKSQEATYLKWYTGQHIYDVLHVDGFVAAQFFKLADSQLTGTHPQKYMMLWGIETDNLPAAFDRLNKRLKAGTIVDTDSIDDPHANSQTFVPITNRVTADEVKGKSTDEVREVALKGVTTDPN